MAKKIISPGEQADNLKPTEKLIQSEKVAVKKASSKALKKRLSTDPIVTVIDINPFIETSNLNPVEIYSRFSDFDISLFKAGKHHKLYELFGSHTLDYKSVTGTYFAVWAPNAQTVSVIGNFNGWNKNTHQLFVRWDGSG
ncbi:MAG: 1,4-alpha-glucan branching protein GlgB, partial [Sphingobacteriaceae bacterium]